MRGKFNTFLKGLFPKLWPYKRVAAGESGRIQEGSPGGGGALTL